jgi:MoaA/NifB/PqqE/SkfB family radical SAM enzyme
MDDKNTNKQFRIYDASKKYIKLSVDEVIANEYNTWENWSCSAGIRGLYIDYDGNVWTCNTSGANQTDNFNYDKWENYFIEKRKYYSSYAEWKNDRTTHAIQFRKTKEAYTNVRLPNTPEMKEKKKGYIGNIIDGFDLPTEWQSCPWKKCTCGADVILAKAKTPEVRSLLSVTNHGYDGKEQTISDHVTDISDHAAAEMNFPIPHQILWDLGRQCNYDCSYCWPNVHNRHEPHKDLNIIIDTCNRMIDQWSKGSEIRWNFGGGEPTLHPEFLQILSHLKSRNQWTMVTSNGTRDHKYWATAAEHLNSINLSAHFDGLKTEKDEDRFVRNVEVICNHHDEHDDDHWLEIKLMAPPQYFDRALTLREKINNLNTMNKPGANGRIKGALSMVPIRDRLSSSNLIDYTEEQLIILRNQ